MPDDLDKRTVKELRELARSLVGEGVSRLKTRAQLLATLLHLRTAGASTATAGTPARPRSDDPAGSRQATGSDAGTPKAGDSTPGPIEGPPSPGPQAAAESRLEQGLRSADAAVPVHEGFFTGAGRPRTALGTRPQLRLFARDPWTLMALWEVSPALRPAGDTGDAISLELTVRELDGQEVLREPMPLSGSRYLQGLQPGTSYVAELWWSVAGRHLEPVAVVPRSATLPVGPGAARTLERAPSRFVRIPWNAPLGRNAIGNGGAPNGGDSAALLAGPGSAPSDVQGATGSSPRRPGSEVATSASSWSGAPRFGAISSWGGSPTSWSGSSWTGMPSSLAGSPAPFSGSSWAGSPAPFSGSSWAGSPSASGPAWAGSPSPSRPETPQSPTRSSWAAPQRSASSAAWAGSPSPWGAAPGTGPRARPGTSSAEADVAWPWAAAPGREDGLEFDGGAALGVEVRRSGASPQLAPAAVTGGPGVGEAPATGAPSALSPGPASAGRADATAEVQRSPHVVTHWAPVQAGFFLGATSPLHRSRGHRRAPPPAALAPAREGEPLAIGEHDEKP